MENQWLKRMLKLRKSLWSTLGPLSCKTMQCLLYVWETPDMATFDQRIGPDGKIVYRVRVRRKGYATQTATFSKLSEAKQWAQITEGTVLEGRHFPTPEAKRHTVTDLIDRYRR